MHKKKHLNKRGIIRTIGDSLQNYMDWHEAEALGKKLRNVRMYLHF